MLEFLLGVIVGAFLGLFLGCLCAMAKASETKDSGGAGPSGAA